MEAARPSRRHEAGQVLWKFLEEEHKVAPRQIVQKGDRRHDQRLCPGCLPDERRRGARNLGIKESLHATDKPQCGSHLRQSQVDAPLDSQPELKHCPFVREPTKSRLLPFLKVSGELSQYHASIEGQVQRGLSPLVPPVVPDSPGEPRVEYAVGRV
jgi:hypothetical protein